MEVYTHSPIYLRGWGKWITGLILFYLRIYRVILRVYMMSHQPNLYQRRMPCLSRSFLFDVLLKKINISVHIWDDVEQPKTIEELPHIPGRLLFQQTIWLMVGAFGGIAILAYCCCCLFSHSVQPNRGELYLSEHSPQFPLNYDL